MRSDQMPVGACRSRPLLTEEQQKTLRRAERDIQRILLDLREDGLTVESISFDRRIVRDCEVVLIAEEGDWP